MATGPTVVSLWGQKDRQDFICSGILLGGKHILTVKHAFEGWPDGTPVYVRLVPRKDGDEPAKILHKHAERDAAILELDTFVEGITPPRFIRRVDKSYSGKPARLHVISPVKMQPALPEAHSVNHYDSDHGEFELTPQTAHGHSGGVAEVQGEIIALLSRRAVNQPIARAVSMHHLAAWFGWIVDAIDPTKSGLSEEAEIAERILGAEVLHRLAKDGTRELRTVAEPFPGDVARLEHASGQERFEKLLVTLHKATEHCLDGWRSSGTQRREAIKDDCRFILGELIKLAVNRDRALDELRAILAATPDRLFIASRRAGSAAAVYCALNDIPLMLDQRKSDDVDIAGGSVIDLGTLAIGVGSDAEHDAYVAAWLKIVDEPQPVRFTDDTLESLQAALERYAVGRVWDKIKGAPVPQQFNDERLEDLQDAIAMERELFGRSPPFFVAAGPREWTQTGGLASASSTLKIGLVVRDATRECPLLVVQERRLINLVCKYLGLLEKL